MRNLILILFVATIFLTPLIISPLTIDYYHPPKELFSQLAIIFCLMLWLIKGIRDRKLDIVRTKFYLLLLLFCLISGLSLIWARSLYLGLRDYVQILIYIGAFFICVNTIEYHRQAILLAKGAFIAGLISAVYAIFQFLGFDFVKYPTVDFPDWRFKLYSTFGNPDFLANYLILIFPIGLAFYFSADPAHVRMGWVKKLLLLVALAVIYSALLATFSLGALLGLVFSIIFIITLFVVEKIKLKNLICQQKFIPHLVISVAMLVIGLGLVSLLFLRDSKINPSSVINRAKSSIAWRSGLANRMTAYRAAYKMLRDNPILGVGIGNFKLRFPEYRGRVLAAQQKYLDPAILDKERDKHVHNDLVQVWAETGIFGFMIFILVLVTIYKNGIFLYFDLFDYKRKLFILGILSSITAFLVHSLVSFPMHIMPNGLFFWTLIGLLYTQLIKQEKRQIVLNISMVQKRFFETGIIIIAILLSVWPIKGYLSDVFLKRMVELDKQGLIEEALTEARTSVFFDPDSNAVIYIGNYANLTKDYETAARSFKKALKNNDEINFHIALAEVYYKENLIKDCMNEYVKALLLDPCSVPMRLRLAELYTENRMYPEATAECQFILMNRLEDENMKKKVTAVLNRIFEEQFFSTYYGKVQVKK